MNAVYWKISNLRRYLWDKAAEAQEDLKVAPGSKESEERLLNYPPKINKSVHSKFIYFYNKFRRVCINYVWSLWKRSSYLVFPLLAVTLTCLIWQVDSCPFFCFSLISEHKKFFKQDPCSEEWKLGNQICLGGEGGKNDFLSSSKIHWWEALASLSKVLMPTLIPLSGDISAPWAVTPGHRLWPHSAHAFFSLLLFLFSLLSLLVFIFLWYFRASSSPSFLLGLWYTHKQHYSVLGNPAKIFVDTCLS